MTLPADLLTTDTALFLDFDGTLVDIVDHPDDVALGSATREALTALSRKLDNAVAILTGRDIEVVDRFLAPLVLPVAGVHGLLRRDATGKLSEPPEAGAFVAEAKTRLAAFVAAEPGLMIETKPVSLALHYRARPELADRCLTAFTEIVDHFPGIELKRGKMVLEAKPTGADKGTALADFMTEPPFAGRVPLFAGDDVTDEDAFRVVNARGGMSIKVGDGETSAIYRARGHRRVPGLARRLRRCIAGARRQTGQRSGDTMSGLDLGLIGNCCIGALVDNRGRIVWCCLPRFDGDPVFHALLGAPAEAPDDGVFAIELDDLVASHQEYIPNTAVLRTVLKGGSGELEIIDFVPRFKWRDRSFRPQMLVRRVRPLSGSPRIRIKVRPRFENGAVAPSQTYGSNHIRYCGDGQTLRLTTDAPIDYVRSETAFILGEEINLVFGPDETLSEGAAQTAKSFEERTTAYWKGWTHRLALPFEWQDAVSRAAITLKLCSYEPTGAVIAAMTTSIPEAPNSERNWDYRFCWVRDAYFVVRALNSLAAVRTMENYVRWIMNVVAMTEGGHIQPVYGIGLESRLEEGLAEALPGYQGMGPVRIGNQAHEHDQHDTYGNIVLGASQAFFDRRLFMELGHAEFQRLEGVGEMAFKLHDKPDAGLWELRSRARVHTSSSLMCWAGCDRLAKIALHLGLADRAAFWAGRAAEIKEKILTHAWSEKRGAFVESFGGETLDASILLMSEVGFLPPGDPRYVSTVEALEKTLGRGPFMMRYEEADDFGVPETTFNICAFWRLDALAKTGQRERAREIFEDLLSVRNPLGLMSEDTAFEDRAAWGNFPQTYSMVGIINGAVRLSKSWESAT